MGKIKIYMNRHPVLRDECEAVSELTDDDYMLLEEMEYVLGYLGAIGISAPQLGVSRRLIVIRGTGNAIPMVNPRVSGIEGEDEIKEEGCLSFPGANAKIERSPRVEITGKDVDGYEFTRTYEGLLARAAQHEIEHLDGILMTDHLSLADRSLFLNKHKKYVRSLQCPVWAYEIPYDKAA